MPLRVFLPLILLPILLAGGEAPATKRPLTMDEVKKLFTEEKDRIVTDWLDMGASHAQWRAFTNAGYTPVVNECKFENGQVLCRKAFKHWEDSFPDTLKPRAYCWSGASQEFFDTKNAELLKTGYALMHKSWCVDEKGELSICAIWTNPAPAPEPPPAAR
jgi:hypothetical protein